MADPKAYQVAEWNGSIGERWLADQVRLDAMLAVFGEAAIKAAAPAEGEYVLDIGCGAGTQPALALAARVGAQGGQVVGIDTSGLSGRPGTSMYAGGCPGAVRVGRRGKRGAARRGIGPSCSRGSG